MDKIAMIIWICALIALKACQSNGASTKHSISTTYSQHNPYGANTYAFGYQVNDTRTGNVQFRDERRYANGEVDGSYGFVRADGRVTVTHYRADPRQGYNSETNTYARPDADQWHKLWPTQRPDILVNRPPAMPLHEVTYNSEEHLNVTQTDGGVAHSSPAEELPIEATVADIVNGRIPLYTDPTAEDAQRRVGFKTIDGQKFVPPEFPLITFQMPAATSEQQHQHQQQQQPQQERGKDNNNEKALPRRFITNEADGEPHLSLPLPLPLDADVDEVQSKSQKSYRAENLPRLDLA